MITFKEYLDEMSKETLASAKEKALQRIQKALKKGDKHTAVKDAQFASKVDKKLDEDIKVGDIVRHNKSRTKVIYDYDDGFVKIQAIDPKGKNNWKKVHKRELIKEDWREDRKKAAAKRAAELDADIKKNPVTPEESKRAEKLLAGAIKAGKFMKDKMGA